MMKIFLLSLSIFVLAACQSGVNRDSDTSAQSASKTIIALGDSLTLGYGLPDEESYPSQLTARLRKDGYDYSVQNAGISGDTTAGLLSRIDWTLEGENPALIILAIGSNDAFQWKSVTDIEKNIRLIIEKIQAKNIPILFSGMKAPLNLWEEYRTSYEDIFPRLAREYSLSYMPFLLEGVAMQPDLNQSDRIHPNAAGYAKVVDILMEALVRFDLITSSPW
jgi:acyl-CoA thioesterase I